MPIATFNLGTRCAIEVDRSTAPSNTDFLSYPWWAGGQWFDLVTDGPTGLQDQQAIIFPTGHGGNRPVNQQAPVAGRKWSEGDFEAPVVADFLGAIRYGALGGVSTNMVPGQGSVLANEPVNLDLKNFVMANQPDGAVLRFEVKGTVPSGVGFVAVSGLDTKGNGASEVLSVTNEGFYWTRTAFSSIGLS